jgi:flap endonuclease-1
MGNADLRQLAVIEPKPFAELTGSVVAIDAHNWLYRYLTTTVRFTSSSIYTTHQGVEVANLIGVVQGLPKFLEADMTPIFVFDGGVTELKTDEVESRRNQRERYESELEAARAGEADAAEISTLESRTQRLTETIQDTTRELLKLLDVPIVEAPAEGEAQAAHMARYGDVDYAGSEDYDTLLLGAPYTLRGLTSSGDPECMDFERTLESLELTWEGLVDAAILMGTDFNEGIAGVGPKTAVKLVREHGDLYGALDARGESIPHADRIRAMFLDPAVTDEYGYDTDIDPDIDAARTYVTEQWEIPADEVERGFERIEDAVVQTGLDRWS